MAGSDSMAEVTERPWTARWVWLADAPPCCYVLFRTDVRVAEPRGCRLRISADFRYRLYVNGRLTGDGPPPSVPHLQYFDTHWLEDVLAAGDNCIGVIARVHDMPPQRRGGLIAELLDAAGGVLAATGPDWRCIQAPGWSGNVQRVRSNLFEPCQEHFDARKMPSGWTQPGFASGQWAAAAVVENPPWSTPVPRDIPYMEQTPRRPGEVVRIDECTWLHNRSRAEDASIPLAQVGLPLRYARCENAAALCTADGGAVLQCSTEHLRDRDFDGVREPTVLLDFGRMLTGYVELDVEAPAGVTLDIGVAERLIDGQFNNTIECPFCFRYTTTAGRQIWRSFAWRGFRYVKLRLHEAYEPVRLHAVRAIQTRYPFKELGVFESGDEVLNGVFDICRHTLRLCCHESIMDTPWREQAQWLGDVAAVSLGGIYACFGDPALPAKFLRQSGAMQNSDGIISNITNSPPWPNARDIPDYSLWWVMAVWNHYLYTGQREWIERSYSVVRGVIAAFLRHRDETGLVSDMPGWVFIDWAHTEKRGQCTALNAILHGALEAAGKMAQVLDDGGGLEEFAVAAGAIRRSVEARLFDSRRGVFADANVAGQLSPMVSEHANFAAILFDLCGPRTAAGIVDHLLVRRDVEATEAAPFFTMVVLQALDKVGRFDLALRVIRDRWGRRMLARGSGSCHEEWGQNGSWRSGTYQGFMRTLSHAWSAHPAEFLIRNLMGLEIVEPGCRVLRVAPKVLPEGYRAVFPTPHGPVTAECCDGKVTVSSPASVEAVRPGQ